MWDWQIDHWWGRGQCPCRKLLSCLTVWPGPLSKTKWSCFSKEGDVANTIWCVINLGTPHTVIRVLQYTIQWKNIAICFSCIMTPLISKYYVRLLIWSKVLSQVGRMFYLTYFTLVNIGTCVKITWNYFPCLVLHKVKVFVVYEQGLVQLLLFIFTSMISFLHCLSSWKTAKL